MSFKPANCSVDVAVDLSELIELLSDIEIQGGSGGVELIEQCVVLDGLNIAYVTVVNVWDADTDSFIQEGVFQVVNGELLPYTLPEGAAVGTCIEEECPGEKSTPPPIVGCECVVLGEENIALVTTISLWNPETESYEATVYQNSGGALVEYTLPDGAVIGPCIEEDVEAEPVLGSSCDTPLYIVPCTVPSDSVSVDSELICNTDTGVYDLVEITTINGVADDSIITPTAVSCGLPVPDIEQITLCDKATGTTHVITSMFDSAGTAIELSDVDTGQSCVEESTVVTNDCDNTLFVATCPDEPLEVVVVNPIPVVDSNLICNADTGVYDLVTITTTNGVPSAPTYSATTISCAGPEAVERLDVEVIDRCIDDTLHQVTVGFNAAGDETLIRDVDTGVECNNGTTVNNECPDAIPVKQCPDDGPFEVTIVDGPTPSITVTPVCVDELVELWVFTDGVQTDTVSTAVVCDDDTDLDVEYLCIEDTVSIHAVTFADGIALAQTVDTGERCDRGTPECVKWSSIYIQLDNTGTVFSESHELTFTNSDGSTTVLNIAPQAGWSQQIAEWAAQLDGAYSGVIDPRCTTGCGGLLAPPTDSPPQPGIFARYVQGTFCPTDTKIPIGAEITDSSNPARIGKRLVFHVIEGPQYRGQVCRTCADGVGELQFEDGSPVPEADLPVCTFACSETLPAVPLSECQFEVISGNWCDSILSGEPDEDDEIVQSEIIITVSSCGPDQTVSYGILDGDSIVPYEPQGVIVDCETGAVPFVEPPECPSGLVWEPVNVGGGWYGILDNSSWNTGATAPFPHLKNGNSYEFTFYDASGAVAAIWQQTSDPYFNNFLSTFEPCTTLPVCANHTSPKGCSPAHVANLASYPAYDAPTAPGDVQNNLSNPALAELWASGWLIDCAGSCTAPFASVEITASTDPTWVGVRKDIITHTKPDTLGYRAQDCGDIYYTDCDGNSIPPLGCCPEAWVGEVADSPLDCAIIECPDPKATAFLLPTPGRPFGSGSYNPENGLPISGETIQELEANMVAAGYETFIGWAAGGPQGEANGEQHWYCPCDGGTFTWAGETTDVECIDNPDPDFVAETTCALQIVDKGKQVLPIGESACSTTGDTGCVVTEITQDDHSGFSVFDQNGLPALKVAALSTAMVDAITAAIADDCLFLLKAGDGATFIGDGTSTGVDAAGSFVLAPGLAIATGCDGTELTSVEGSQREPSTTTLITYCGKVEDTEPREVLFTEDACVASKLDTVIGLLTELTVPCPKDEFSLTNVCQAYSNPLASGYDNWRIPGDQQDLAEEFGCDIPGTDIWVRIVEFDCDGVSQSQTGQVFGPYSQSASATDQFFTDLAAAVSGSCLVPSANNGGVTYTYDPTVDSTLVLQEGVNVGPGVCWFTSAQGIVVRDGIVGDFISSTGNSSATSYASDGVDDFDSYAPAEDCATA